MKNINQIFKEKHINLTIDDLRNLLQIIELYPDYFSNINLNYFNEHSTNIGEDSISEIMDNPSWINLKFWKIYNHSVLSPDEFQFWWKMLHSDKTRFSLTSIDLKFSSLSECLTALSLCSDCPELESVYLRYSEADVENEGEIIEQAKQEFRQKFGFIRKLTIWKDLES